MADTRDGLAQRQHSRVPPARNQRDARMLGGLACGNHFWNVALSRPSGTYQIFCWPSQRAPRSQAVAVLRIELGERDRSPFLDELVDARAARCAFNHAADVSSNFLMSIW